jgi:hypothetical protein
MAETKQELSCGEPFEDVHRTLGGRRTSLATWMPAIGLVNTLASLLKRRYYFLGYYVVLAFYRCQFCLVRHEATQQLYTAGTFCI